MYTLIPRFHVTTLLLILDKSGIQAINHNYNVITVALSQRR
jgi:hypothetical protein